MGIEKTGRETGRGGKQEREDSASGEQAVKQTWGCGVYSLDSEAQGRPSGHGIHTNLLGLREQMGRWRKE